VSAGDGVVYTYSMVFVKWWWSSFWK